MTTTVDAKDEVQARLKKLELPYGKWQHYKGPCYWVFATSIDEGTLEALVHYESLAHGTCWTRTVKNFTEEVTSPSGEKKPRFEFIGGSK